MCPVCSVNYVTGLYPLIFLSPPWERNEVRGNISFPLFHPHPDPLPSREREIFVRVFIGGKRGIFIAFSLDR
jgi:hypothetical protein